MTQQPSESRKTRDQCVHTPSLLAYKGIHSLLGVTWQCLQVTGMTIPSSSIELLRQGRLHIHNITVLRLTCCLLSQLAPLQQKLVHLTL